ncbi:unnamed protein product [Haemonchus placei]|uniref:PIPK domain-containing protein n=1 Tax=Haemonchus placei TaxID=6290 RepID=A0A158QR91_HAEPC|nr:unnamed protein product [Haemonchus placei]
MSILPDVELFGGLVIGDGGSATLPSGPFGGLSSTDEKKELLTAFNGREYVFKAFSMKHTSRGFSDSHVFLLCLSVARQTSAEETVQLADRKLWLWSVEVSAYAYEQAESYAKRIGASKYFGVTN